MNKVITVTVNGVAQVMEVEPTNFAGAYDP